MRDTSITGLKTDKTEFKVEIDDWFGLQEFSVKGQQLLEINLLNLMHGYNIERINLSKNNFSELELISLHYCRNLVSLDISKNKLATLDLSSFRSDPAFAYNLKSINLSENSLNKFDLYNLAMCSNLEFLNLEDNNIAKLDLCPLIYCTNLEELLIDDNVQIEWRNTLLPQEKFSEGLRKYSTKIKKAWKEYLKEVENFRISEPAIEERLARANWLQDLEQQKGFEWLSISPFSRPIYNEVRKCYVYGCFRGTIGTVFSLMEVFLTKEIPYENLLQEKRLLKKKDKTKIEPKKLNLSLLAKIAKKKKYISPKLYEQIYMYLPVRHGITHYPDSTIPLGFYRTSLKGKATKFRGGSFESPNRKPRLPLKLQEAAETGIILFLDLLKELNPQTS